MEAVRPAEEHDAERIEALTGELAAWIASCRGGAFLIGPPGRPWWEILGAASLAHLLADPTRRVLVGTLDGVVTGVAACHATDPAHDGVRTGVLDACYVEPEARGLGLGQLLAATALAWLRSQGCHGVDGLALPGDRAAKQFFESAGLKARLLTMHLDFE
jgi:GNAT superfamily N-acetyltransferase